MSLSPLVIAAPGSGHGKTSVTLALLAALTRRGVAVTPFKVGPDFIDPGHHALACGRASRNLDGWMCERSIVEQVFRRGCSGTEVAVVEGVMGLFDGASGSDDSGSTAQIAKWLNGRVILVVDAGRQARSAAALVKGFVDFEPHLEFAGVIFNNVASANHAELLREALVSTPGLPPLLGCLTRDSEVTLPERHLGLLTAEEAGRDAAFFSRLADWFEAGVDVEALLENFISAAEAVQKPAPAEGETVRIGVARDAAFCFYYQDNLEALEAAGAELVEFSPLHDARLPDGLHGLYLGGGYPEVHAGQLTANASLREQIRSRIAAGMPAYAECGGLVYLCEAVDGQSMCGLLPAGARMLPRRKALGYREVELSDDGPLGPSGTRLRGHEFHYSELEMPSRIQRAYRVFDRKGRELGTEGYRLHNLLASYVHLHFGSEPQVAKHLMNFMRSHAQTVARSM